MQGGFLTPQERQTVEEIFTRALDSKADVVQREQLYSKAVSTAMLKRMACDRFYCRTGYRTFSATNEPSYVTTELWDACRTLSSKEKLRKLGVTERDTVLRLHEVFDENMDEHDFFYQSTRSYSRRACENTKMNALASPPIPELLSEEQEGALRVLLESSNHVFLTGAQGCGKVSCV